MNAFFCLLRESLVKWLCGRGPRGGEHDDERSGNKKKKK
jgi:hypothetical protein